MSQLYTPQDSRIFIIVIEYDGPSHRNSKSDIGFFSDISPVSMDTICQTELTNLFDYNLVSLPISDTKDIITWYDNRTSSFIPLTMAEAQTILIRYKEQSLSYLNAVLPKPNKENEYDKDY